MKNRYWWGVYLLVATNYGIGYGHDDECGGYGFGFNNRNKDGWQKWREQVEGSKNNNGNKGAKGRQQGG